MQKVWLDLLSTDYGLMSFIVILLILFAMIGFVIFILRHLGKS